MLYLRSDMLSNLFKPIELSGITIRNRIAMAPMGIGSYNEDETFTDDYIDFIKARSEDTGLIISTGTRVSEKYGGLKVNGIYDDRFIPSLSKLASAAKSGGARFFLQILNFGPVDPFDPYCPFDGLEEYKTLDEGSRPKQLSIAQIEELVEEFAQAARRAKDAGCDGVELFGSEDALIASFICPHFNKRQDKYGKDMNSRMRFPLEIISRIRELCGEDFPIGFKYNAIWDIENGIDKDLSVEIARILSEAKVAYIHEWSFESWEKPMSMFKISPMPSLYQKRNSTIDIAKMLKEAVDVPIIAVGGILKPDEADELIGNGSTDMVALGRAFIADESWAKHAKSQKDLRPCIRCHVCHNEVAMLEKIVKCSVNPDVLANTKIRSVKKSKNIVIAGGGPAGISAAVYAAKRGHRVVLFENEKELGGKLVAGSRPDFKYEFKDLLAYLKGSVEGLDIDLRLGVKANKNNILEESPDELVVCIGAQPKIPQIATGDLEVLEAVSALKSADSISGKKILVVGGGDVGCETALHLKDNGNEVVIIEVLENLMEEEDIKHNSEVLAKMIKDAGIKIYLGSALKQVRGNIATIEGSGVNEQLSADIVVFATGYYVDNKTVDDIASTVHEPYIIGDCRGPRRLVDAIGEGFKTGISI